MSPGGWCQNGMKLRDTPLVSETQKGSLWCGWYRRLTGEQNKKETSFSFSTDTERVHLCSVHCRPGWLVQGGQWPTPAGGLLSGWGLAAATRCTHQLFPSCNCDTLTSSPGVTRPSLSHPVKSLFLHHHPLRPSSRSVSSPSRAAQYFLLTLCCCQK